MARVRTHEQYRRNQRIALDEAKERINKLEQENENLHKKIREGINERNRLWNELGKQQGE